MTTETETCALAPLPAPEPVATTYPSHYPTRFVLRAGITVTAAADTFEALDKSGHWRRGRTNLRVVMTQYAPDSLPVTIHPTPGGAWGGKCGASAWVVDHDETYRQTAQFVRALDPCMPADTLGVEEVGDPKSVSWWLIGKRTAEDGYDGFRLYCATTHGHDGDCRNGPFTWDPSTGQPTVQAQS